MQRSFVLLFYYSALCLLLLLGLVGCQLGATAEPPEAQINAASDLSETPTTSSPPQSATPSDTTLVTPDASKASLEGTILHISPTTEPEPYQNVVLYLGEVLLDSAGNKSAAGFTDASPRAETDDQGRFTFQNVEPGEYALFFWTPIGSVMLRNPETGQDMLFELEAGEAVDIGTLSYDLPTP